MPDWIGKSLEHGTGKVKSISPAVCLSVHFLIFTWSGDVSWEAPRNTGSRRIPYERPSLSSATAHYKVMYYKGAGVATVKSVLRGRSTTHL